MEVEPLELPLETAQPRAVPVGRGGLVGGAYP